MLHDEPTSTPVIDWHPNDSCKPGPRSTTKMHPIQWGRFIPENPLFAIPVRTRFPVHLGFYWKLQMTKPRFQLFKWGMQNVQLKPPYGSAKSWKSTAPKDNNVSRRSGPCMSSDSLQKGWDRPPSWTIEILSKWMVGWSASKNQWIETITATSYGNHTFLKRRGVKSFRFVVAHGRKCVWTEGTH